MTWIELIHLIDGITIMVPKLRVRAAPEIMRKGAKWGVLEIAPP